jgi:hypothetical protein
MADLIYAKGDATRPQGYGTKYIIHCCNDVGAWGAGFVMALSGRWKAPEACYRDWALGASDQYPAFVLGSAQSVRVMRDTVVVNIVGQHGVAWRVSRNPPIRYDAIACGLQNTRVIMLHDEEEGYRANPGYQGPFSVHCPRLGAGLAGGDWATIESLLLQELVAYDISVTVYDLP